MGGACGSTKEERRYLWEKRHFLCGSFAGTAWQLEFVASSRTIFFKKNCVLGSAQKAQHLTGKASHLQSSYSKKTNLSRRPVKAVRTLSYVFTWVSHNTDAAETLTRGDQNRLSSQCLGSTGETTPPLAPQKLNTWGMYLNSSLTASSEFSLSQVKPRLPAKAKEAPWRIKEVN